MLGVTRATIDTLDTIEDKSPINQPTENLTSKTFSYTETQKATTTMAGSKEARKSAKAIGRKRRRRGGSEV